MFIFITTFMFRDKLNSLEQLKFIVFGTTYVFWDTFSLSLDVVNSLQDIQSPNSIFSIETFSLCQKSENQYFIFAAPSLPHPPPPSPCPSLNPSHISQYFRDLLAAVKPDPPPSPPLTFWARSF